VASRCSLAETSGTRCGKDWQTLLATLLATSSNAFSTFYGFEYDKVHDTT